MKKEDKKRIKAVIGKYIRDPHVQQMKEYIQHGNVTTYSHVISVVKMSFYLNKRLGLGADEEVLFTAALLHDFYLYDWHDKPLTDLHGYRHPYRAAENAKKIFDVNDKVYGAILTHMWPFTLFKLPKTKEAWIVCMADKLSSMAETLWLRK
ncbi:MAG: HD domain-containing protein [Eubacterium sp.]|nr:HD domain-containing protein [Eubacterium sp.]